MIGYSALQPSLAGAGAGAGSVTLLSIAALLSSVQRRRRVKAYLFAAAVSLMVLVGISRVYLGVHWPSDVLAGWALGAAWALLCVLGSRALPHGQDPLPPDAR
ncbi:MAG: phosphatase PAP2 family protein [Myxococcota bacterium]|nr:phosphatase PAP2 family protein [Myxococcota bacterium]